MIAAVLMALAAGARSMTPLAAVAWLARRNELPNDAPVFRLLSHDIVVAGATALAIGEMAGDKLRSAPDRIVIPGMAARIATGALAGAALSHRRNERGAALVAAAVTLLSSCATFAARRRAMQQYGQEPSGAVEDIAVVALALIATQAARR